MKKERIPDPIRQVILRKLARWVTRDWGDDLYYLYEAINLILADIGYDVLKEHYKERYSVVIERFKKIGMLLSVIKIYYDGLEKATKSDKESEIDSERFLLYKRELMKIPLVDTTLYEMFMVLIKNTPLKNMEIPNDAFKIEERKYIPIRFFPTGERAETEMESMDEGSRYEIR